MNSPVREALRVATASAHARLDAMANGLNLANRADYGRFLIAQSGPVFALEQALEAAHVAQAVPDWPNRRRTEALMHDLDVLGLSPRLVAPIRLNADAEMFGVLYVLEGSRLGARYLMKRVLAAAPEVRGATRFLEHGKDRPLWPTFVTLLDANVGQHEITTCARGAIAAFAMFERSFEILPAEPLDAG